MTGTALLGEDFVFRWRRAKATFPLTRHAKNSQMYSNCGCDRHQTDSRAQQSLPVQSFRRDDGDLGSDRSWLSFLRVANANPDRVVSMGVGWGRRGLVEVWTYGSRLGLSDDPSRRSGIPRISCADSCVGCGLCSEPCVSSRRKTLMKIENGVDSVRSAPFVSIKLSIYGLWFYGQAKPTVLPNSPDQFQFSSLRSILLSQAVYAGNLES